MIGEEKFIAAIIEKAVEDASYDGSSKFQLKHKVEAIDWMFNPNSEHHWSFLDYCKMIGVAPSRIQRKVKVHLNPKMTMKQQKIMKGNNARI
jgi:hypothetical protein|tara:strand:- start:3 stop:278 length:276 start_codon:yes stop_codon:yes gene_type:complete